MNPDQATPSQHRHVDAERDTAGRPFDQPTGFSGQDYSIEREQAMGEREPSGHPLIGDPQVASAPADDPAGRDVPPENGHRAWIDSKTGEVHGSGSGAGGGNDGEDFDEETAGGS